MDLADLNVLVVDDFPAMRKLLIKSLRQMGVSRIKEARDGTEAVELMGMYRVDLLVSDWNMPNMGGLELLRWVRNTYDFARLPVLMVTSKGQHMDVVQAVKAGVDSYVIKPFTHELLEAKVSKLAGQAAEFCAARAAIVEAAAQSAATGQIMEDLTESPEPPQTEEPSATAADTPAAEPAAPAPDDAPAAAKEPPA